MESEIRDNPSMSRFEMSLGDGALAVAYYKVEDGRIALLHTKAAQELSGLRYGPRWAQDRFRCPNGGEALQRSSFNGRAIWFAQLSTTGSRRLRRSPTLMRAEAALTLTAAMMSPLAANTGTAIDLMPGASSSSLMA